MLKPRLRLQRAFLSINRFCRRTHMYNKKVRWIRGTDNITKAKVGECFQDCRDMNVFTCRVKSPGPNTQIQTGLFACHSEGHRTCSRYAFSGKWSYYSLFAPESLRILYAGLAYVYKFGCEAYLALRAR